MQTIRLPGAETWFFCLVAALTLSGLYFRGNLLGLRAWGESAQLLPGWRGLLGKLCACRLCVTSWAGGATALLLTRDNDVQSAFVALLFGFTAGYAGFCFGQAVRDARTPADNQTENRA